MRQDGGEPDKAGVFLNRGGLHGRDLVFAETLADNIETARERGIAEAPLALSVTGERMVAVSDFSGLVISACGLANAAAIAPICHWRLARLNAPPELLLGVQQQVLVECIGGDTDLDPFATSRYITPVAHWIALIAYAVLAFASTIGT